MHGSHAMPGIAALGLMPTPTHDGQAPCLALTWNARSCSACRARQRRPVASRLLTPKPVGNDNAARRHRHGGDRRSSTSLHATSRRLTLPRLNEPANQEPQSHAAAGTRPHGSRGPAGPCPEHDSRCRGPGGPRNPTTVMPRLPCDSCPNSQNSKPHNSRYNSSSTNTVTRTNSTTHPSRTHRTLSKISK
jgi:hypothetical protein